MRTKHQARRELDKIDRQILRLLQAEGRMPFTELGERIGLSTTPCTERVRRLFDLDADPDGYLTVGASASLSAARGDQYRRARLTLAYSLRDDADGDDAHLVVLQGQFAF